MPELQRTFWYTAPSGDTALAPALAEMLSLMRTDREWGPYSPVGVLVWHEHPPRNAPDQRGLGTQTKLAQLLFVRHPKYGWYFEFDCQEPDCWMVSVRVESGHKGWTRHWACGEQLYFLKECFVQQADGEQTVTEFFQSPTLPKAIAWEEFDRRVPRREERPATR